MRYVFLDAVFRASIVLAFVFMLSIFAAPIAQAAASEQSFFQRAAHHVFCSVAGLFSADACAESVNPSSAPLTREDQLAATLYGIQQKDDVATPETLEEADTQPTIIQNITQPVIERVVNTREVIKESGLTREQFEIALNELRKELYNTQASPDDRQTTAVWRAIALSQKIDNLSSVTITGSPISGSSGSFATLAASGATTLSDALTVSGTTSLAGLTTSGNASIGGDLTITGTTTLGTITTSLTEGSVAFAGSGGTLSQDNSNFFWDDTSNRLGLGTATPSDTLDITGTLNTTGAATLGSTLSVTGATTLSSTLGVTGTSTLATTTVSGDLTVDTSSLYVDSTNNRVGIGTAAPGATLEINSGTSPAELLVKCTTSVCNADLTIQAGSGGTGIVRFNNSSGTLLSQIYSANGQSDLVFATNGNTQQMVIDSSGNVGIGTTTPSTKLAVLSTTEQLRLNYDGANYTSLTVNSTGDLTVAPTGNATIFQNAVDATTGFQVLDTDGGTPILNVDTTNERVGIGTAAPGSQLHIVQGGGAGGADIKIEGTALDDYPSLIFTNDARTWQIYGVDGSNNDSFGIYDAGAAAYRFLIDTSGNVGIGTTGPGQKLEISGGNIKVTNTDDTNLNLFRGATSIAYLGDGGGGNGGQLYLYDSGGSQAVVLREDGNASFIKNGNVGIGTTTPSAQLHTTGSVRFATFGAGTLQTDASGNVSVSSDERLKDVVENFNRGKESLLGIEPIVYQWNETSGFDTEHTYAGFSAQNVQENIPEAVGEDPQGFLTLSDRPILAALVNAVKEMWGVVSGNRKKIAAQDEKDAEFETRITALEAQLAGVSASNDNTPEATHAPTIEIIGNSPAEIAMGAEYADLGVVAKNAEGNDLSATITIDGVTMTTVQLDTSIDATYTIEYSTVDAFEQVATTTRTVIVGTGILSEEDIDGGDLVATTTPSDVEEAVTTTDDGTDEATVPEPEEQEEAQEVSDTATEQEQAPVNEAA